MSTTGGEKGAMVKKYYCSSVERSMGLEKHVFRALWLGQVHLFGIYGFYIGLYERLNFSLVASLVLYGYFAGAGVTMGAHRYWTHKSFKAKTPLRILLAWMFTTAGQNTIFTWCKDHRVHHKYVDTEADPHNSRKGFWHSHIGWLIVPPPPGFEDKAATIDFSDLDNDPIVRFQAKYYLLLAVLAIFVIPMSLFNYLDPGMSWFELFCFNYVWYILSNHFTFLVNSAAHIWGYRPYEKGIYPRENKLVSILAVGEGWHNYHHTFPWDYKAAEIGIYRYNWSAMFLDFFAWIGWAYDLKSVSPNVVRDRVRRTGDGSHATYGRSQKSEEAEADVKHLWGWGDEDMTNDDYKVARIYKPSVNPSG